MSEKLYEALESCLQTLERGADLESTMMLFPDMKDRLRPLLEASIGARSLALSVVPVDAMQRGRARVLQHAAEMREAAQQSRRRVVSFRRFATVLALALVFFLSGTGLVRASNGALPGDNLYPVKRTWEDVQLLFVINPESREELESEFEQERLEEVDELLKEGRHEIIAFVGIVSQQNGDQWLVSGIPVQIVAASQLPAEPVGVGAFVAVEGFTNLQGFVEARRIEVLESIGFLSPITPVEIEGESETERSDSHESEAGQNGDTDKMESESSSGEDKESGDDTSDGGDSSEDNEDDSENSGSDSSDKNDESENDNSGSSEDDSTEKEAD